MDKIIKTQKQEVRDFAKCKGIKKVEICAKSGQLPVTGVCSHDPEKNMVRTEYFEAGTEPTESCENHIVVTFCSKSDHVARKFCPDKFLYQRVFRIRPDGSSGTTDDSPYCLNFSPDNYKCDIHTRLWKEMKDLKEQQKQLEEQQQQANPPDGSAPPDNSGGLTLQNIGEGLRRIFQ